MQFAADLHMHTKYSDGRGTIEEMMQAAIARKLEKIAITDHGPKNIGVGIKSPEQLLDIKKEAEQVSRGQNIKVLVGVEADILGVNGEIDIPETIYRQLDLLLVGLHPYVFPGTITDGLTFVLPNQLYKLSEPVRRRVIEINTKAVIAVLRKHPVDILTHPGLNMPIDYEQVARACAETNTLYEINTGHKNQHFQPLSIIEKVSRQGVRFVVNSDAHYPDTVGELQSGWELLQAAGVAPERVVNIKH
ncbi:MAG: PHP domain-containing protein [Thermoanaerobacteraceae bacterium]|nr:PHP domain-containing protein [Thermoanaerobacteraceae bacterium]